jgi:hypothetical protein
MGTLKIGVPRFTCLARTSEPNEWMAAVQIAFAPFNFCETWLVPFEADSCSRFWATSTKTRLEKLGFRFLSQTTSLGTVMPVTAGIAGSP